MKAFHLICVGKLKDKNLEAIEADYLKRLNHPPLIIHEVKASAENKEAESLAVAKKLQELGESSYRIALSEWGKKYESVDFAKWTEKLIESPSKIVFIISGAEGFTTDFIKSCQESFSLSGLTFPHKLARILLIEQLYRAQTIRMGHPYHN